MRLKEIKLIAWPNDRFSGFAFLWALGQLFHIASYQIWTKSLPDFLLSLAALGVLLYSRSVPAFLFLIVTQLWNAWTKMPYVPNHLLFAAFVHLTLLTAYAQTAWREKSWKVNGNDWLQVAQGALCCELLILYFFAFFSKLNSNYFNTDISCARFLYLQFERYSWLPLAQGQLIFKGTILISALMELVIPVLLIPRRTRWLGILCGIVFHLALGLNPHRGYYNFSTMLFALYFLFVPAAIINDLRIPEEKMKGKMVLGFFASIIALCVGLIFVPRIVFVAYAALLLYFLYRQRLAFKKTLVHSTFALFQWHGVALTLWPLLVFLNGLCPYVGLKTETSFTMYSNLRTEFSPNHFIVGTLPLSNYQEPIEILDSSEPLLAAWVTKDTRPTLFELRRLLSREKLGQHSLTYEYRGDVYHAELVASDPLLNQSPPYLLRKLFRFRAVPKLLNSACVH